MTYSKKYAIDNFGAWWLVIDHDYHFFKDKRQDLQPRKMVRTLWSLTRVLEEDGSYMGRLAAKGYEVTRQMPDAIKPGAA